MKLFTEIVKEAQREWGNFSFAQIKEFDKIARKSKSVSREYLQILNDTIQLGIVDGEMLDKIINGSTGDMKWVATNHGGPEKMYEEIRRLAGKIKPELKGLPQFMTDAEFNDVISGKREIGDITLDLETERGRERCARQYAPLVTAIASKYRGSGLDWDGLISAGQLGLVKAMNDYHRPDEYVDVEDGLTNDDKKEVKKQKGQTFKQYAGWRIRFQILNDINELSRTVKISQYEYEKNKATGNTKGNFNTVSVDTTIDDEGQTLVDRLTQFSNGNDAFKPDTKAQWEKLYKLIDDRFSTRTASVFYKSFGLHGYKQMKGVEIAKEMGITGAAVSMSVKDVMKFIKSNKKTSELLQDLLYQYSESLIINNSPETLHEVMISDDVFIMLTECTKWLDKKVFNNTIGSTLEEFDADSKEFIIMCLENNIEYIDNNFDEHRSTLVSFLECLYPTECIRRKSDVDIITMMVELSENFKNHNVSE